MRKLIWLAAATAAVACTGAAQAQDAQGHGRVGDLVSDPIERHFLDEMAEGSQQVTGPK